MAEQLNTNNQNEVKIPKRILNTLLSSLEAGVVPRLGAPYIAIGRQQEIETLLESLSAVAEGGGAVRFLIGRYGSGKSFLIQLLRGYALERGFLCADADLSPERRLAGTSGGGLATYRELMRNLASKASPDGGALPVVLSRHYSSLCSLLAEDGIMPEDESFSYEMKKKVYSVLSAFEGNVGGFDFSRVLAEYYSACICDDSDKKSACLRWLRGEYSTKTEAKNTLGFSVSAIISDDNWYDYIKLWAVLAARLGYKGLVVFVDECVNLYKISNRISRECNYEKILSIFNDTLQGRAEHLGIIFGGTPQFLEDTRRGLFSYEALRSRLCDGRFAEYGYTNINAPVIRLRRLSDNEFLALIARLTRLVAQRDSSPELVTGDEMVMFLKSTLARTGSNELATPREIIRDYLTLLSIMKSNPDASFEKLVKSEPNISAEDENKENTLTSAPASASTASSLAASHSRDGIPVTKRIITLDDIDI